MGKSSIALAESALLKGMTRDAMRLANKAKSILPKNSPDWIRAGDIIITLKNKEGNG